MKLKTRTPLLQFDGTQKKVTESLSTALFVGDQLWVASDELTSVERLTTDDGLTFGNQKSFPLGEFINLPAVGTDFDQEVDVEGMDFDGLYLWIVGSHSPKRKKVDKVVEEDEQDEDEPVKSIKKLAKVEVEGNRFILARIPLVTSADGEQTLVRSTESRHVAAQLPGGVDGNALIEAIKRDNDGKGDPHLAKFLSIPGKDNGLDIEGLAVKAERIFLGLRGPVLRGWAVVIEVVVEDRADGQLSLKHIGPKGRPYRKHFLDLDGLGIRALHAEGSDLLVLAGPTMVLDGPTAIYRWRGALDSEEERIVRRTHLPLVLEIPFGQGTDHAEGMTVVPGEGVGPRQILVVYDSPSEGKREGEHGVRAEVFDLPDA
jgi:hypothetical protein